MLVVGEVSMRSAAAGQVRQRPSMVGDDLVDNVVGVASPAHRQVGAATPIQLRPVVDEVIQRLRQRPSGGPAPTPTARPARLP